MRVALDTNVIVYSEDLAAQNKRQVALDFLEALENHECLLPAQVLGELYRVLDKKLRWQRSRISKLVMGWSAYVSIVATTPDVLHAAMELAEAHHFDIWDAIILAAAAEARCDILLSEDMHNGFNWRGVTVIDPFVKDLHPLAVHLLGRR